MHRYLAWVVSRRSSTGPSSHTSAASPKRSFGFGPMLSPRAPRSEVVAHLPRREYAAVHGPPAQAADFVPEADLQHAGGLPVDPALDTNSTRGSRISHGADPATARWDLIQASPRSRPHRRARRRPDPWSGATQHGQPVPDALSRHAPPVVNLGRGRPMLWLRPEMERWHTKTAAQGRTRLGRRPSRPSPRVGTSSTGRRSPKV